ncbi:MAG: hydroxymyristoyl-ACP dehydratase [Rubrivivax sp.]|nr:hydroxymyristoyl-ACP dehydratase [Rubrivivax sp.]
MAAPATLNHAGIAARIPHAGRMALLDRLLGWNADELRCSASGHADPEHPLRGRDGLPATAAIEYAAQAMALHGGLRVEATDPGARPLPGFLASARGVRLHVTRLDDAAGPLLMTVTRQAGDAEQALYRFTLDDGNGRRLVEGRAAVVLNRPLEVPQG